MNSISVKTIKVGRLDTNCYLVEHNNKLIIIDPGDDPDYIVDNIQRQNKIPDFIFLTHGHFDHLLAVFDLQLIYNIPVYLHAADHFLLDRINSSVKYFLNDNTNYQKPTINLTQINNSDLIKSIKNISIIHSPGHTPGGTSFLFEKKYLFSGDLIFKGGNYGRYDFNYSNKNDLFDSINNILKLKENINVFPGHGDVTSSFEEKKYYK